MEHRVAYSDLIVTDQSTNRHSLSGAGYDDPDLLLEVTTGDMNWLSEVAIVRNYQGYIVFIPSRIKE